MSVKAQWLQWDKKNVKIVTQKVFFTPKKVRKFLLGRSPWRWHSGAARRESSFPFCNQLYRDNWFINRMLETTTSSIDITGLESKTMESRPSVLKIPANLFLLAETRSVRRTMYDAIEELEQTLRILIHNPTDTFFNSKLYSKIDEGEVMLTEYEHKLNKLYGILPDGCRDIDQLRDDFNTPVRRS